jgi:hypothetical protein
LSGSASSTLSSGHRRRQGRGDNEDNEDDSHRHALYIDSPHAFDELTENVYLPDPENDERSEATDRYVHVLLCCDVFES